MSKNLGFTLEQQIDHLLPGRFFPQIDWSCWRIMGILITNHWVMLQLLCRYTLPVSVRRVLESRRDFHWGTCWVSPRLQAPDGPFKACSVFSHFSSQFLSMLDNWNITWLKKCRLFKCRLLNRTSHFESISYPLKHNIEADDFETLENISLLIRILSRDKTFRNGWSYNNVNN